ncbi:MAG: potassium-transporting ATPase subunit KdpC [Desulfurella sp.]|uniref:Potassium-transporting ATPase KdpC subunit n=1 Tax=Desulfurella multipotens TaxID=79269 RepID=A0A1G6HYC7_9BACT|nr:potassium-transporting ATPase subunit KdpC [Desulfurella multipotens]PMP65969.1 MAG: potassium-transporting ATPase subunit KdpC [Desulfurella multipotens]SDB99180.1 K+-transporting ATPase ATPase C chain [Desulfurella multipotens]
MKNLKSGLIVFAFLFIITGVVYPLIVTGIGQLVFKSQVNGSLIYIENKPVGSKLIGQPFQNPGLFWSRPSSTDDFPYNALSSGGSNLGPTNQILVKRVEERIAYLRKNDFKGQIPSSLVLDSGSGLDPDITPQAAYSQIPRISMYTHIPQNVLKSLVSKHIKKRQLGFLGHDRVNVLELNLALIKMEKDYAGK